MKKFDNFSKALENLEKCRDYKEPYDMVTETGLVGLFEICFEQSWKAVKEALEYHGYDSSQTGSPRMIIKLAYSAGMINDEELWLEALAARNDVSHSYNENVALGIIQKTKNKFIDMFLDLKTELLNNWI